MLIKQTARNQILNDICGKTTSPIVGSYAAAWLGLLTTMPSEDGTGASEVNGDNYSRIEIHSVMNTTYWSNSNGDDYSGSAVTYYGRIGNTDDILFPAAGSSWGSIVGWALYPSSSSTVPYAWDTFNDGDISVAVNGMLLIRKGCFELVIGERGGQGDGPGWSPASADYTWTYALFNQYSDAVWNAALSRLTYDENDECEIAKYYTSEGVLAENLGKLVAIDCGEGVYAVFYAVTYSPGTEDAFEDSILIYASGDSGSTVKAGFHEFDVALDPENLLTGSLVPVIEEPVSHTLSGWDYLWAGYQISFGEFGDWEVLERGREVASSEISYLDASDFNTWFRPNNALPAVLAHRFQDVTSLEDVEFSPVVNTIGESAFEGCTSLATVEWKDVTNGFYLLASIGARAFYGCTSLTTVDIYGETYFSSIGDYAFANCPNLESVTVRRYTAPPTLGTGAFDTTSLQHIYVPATKVNTYKAAAGWSDYASYITAIPS